MKKQSQLHTHKKIVSQDPSTEEKHPVSAFRFHPPLVAFIFHYRRPVDRIGLEFGMVHGIRFDSP